jgi:DNA-nicking Smr family endonuclease
MTKAGRKPLDSGRGVTTDEAELWKHATGALEPVKAKPRVTAARKIADTHEGAAVPSVARSPVSRPSLPPKEAPSRTGPSGAPQALAEFDRRKVRQIASGKVGIAARIDLHGLRQHDAHTALRAFLQRAHAAGHRTVLVITGKGGAADKCADSSDLIVGGRQRGVLKRSVPNWLEAPDLRAIVLSYAQASARHGGAGALYVQLRRPARADSGHRSG